MCHPDTDVRASVLKTRIFALVLGIVAAFPAAAQTATAWKHVAGTTIDEGLAGPASGPVDSVWYAPGGRALLARTQSGRIFEIGGENSAIANWRLNTAGAPSQPPANLEAFAETLPEPGAKIQSVSGRLYAAAPSNLYESEDNGQTWVNLTGFNNRSILGGGFTALAVSPADPQELTAANRFGVWRSLDGGLSWRALNEDLPNLPVRKLIGRGMILLADGEAAEAAQGLWKPVAAADPELALRARFGAALHTDLSAAAESDAVAYAGTGDGRLLVSQDGGSTWGAASAATGSPIARIWVDGESAGVALAASGSRLFRTVNAGLFWDDVTGALPPGEIHGIAADRAAGVVYLATDAGVYGAKLSLNDAGAAAPSWASISRDLPAAPAWDVALNPDNTMTVALDGYGVFESPAPYRSRGVRLVSGADLTERAAAPGSLVSVLGANVATAKNDGIAYPVLAASNESSQLQVPFEATPGTYSLALQGANDRWTVPLTVKDAAPAIFVDADGSPLVLDAESGLVLDSKVPIYAGSSVEILATGLGKVTPAWPTGVPAPVDSPPTVNANVTAFLDGQQIEVTRAVLAPDYVGYYLIRLRIPSIVNRGANEFRIVMNGEESNKVKLYLEPNAPGQ